MPSAFPLNHSVLVFIEKFEFITWNQSDIVLVRKNKERHPLFVDVVVKPDFNVSLSLRFLKTLVVISFELDKRLKDILVLSWISIP